MIRNIVLKKPADYRNPFVTSELATNMLGTLLKTSTECSKLTITELLQDCSRGSSITCFNGQDSCMFAEATANDIFSKTFDKWKIKYEFTASTETGQMIHLGEKCKADKKSKLYPIPSTVTIDVVLDVCS